MIRALFLYLLGATFEVRLVKLATGKNIPGQCLYRGGYFGARKAFDNAVRKQRAGFTIRLQSISMLKANTKTNVSAFVPGSDTTPFEIYNSLDEHPPKEPYPNQERYHANQVTLGTLPYNSGPATPMSNKWLAEKNQEREAEERKIQVAAGMTDTGELIEREVQIIPSEILPDPEYLGVDAGVSDSYTVEVGVAHEHDRDGPWEFEEATGGYTATCSVCGELMPEEAEA